MEHEEDCVKLGLKKLAFGDVSGVVKAISKEVPNFNRLKSDDFFNVMSIKRLSNGCMEVKFFDRLQALRGLCEFMNDRQNGADKFLSALANSAENSEDC